MNIDDALEEGERPSDVGNQLIGDAVKTRAGAIAKLAALCDLDLALYLDPEDERWAWHEDTPTVMVECWLALKEAAAELALVVRQAEQVAFDALKAGNVDAVWLDGGSRGFKPRQVPRRTYPPEKKDALRSEMTRAVCRHVAANPLTGELEEDRARVAVETLTQLDRWQTIDPAKFKLTTLRAEGLDVDEFAETEWSQRIEEVRG